MHKFSATLLVAVLQFGCGGQPQDPSYPDVTGKVTLDGKPLAGATVTFVPTGANVGNMAQAATDEEGRFKLKGPRGSTGAAPGDYKVAISSMQLPDGKPLAPDAPIAGSGAVEVVPPQYSDRGRTTLTATVPTGGGNFDFALKKR